ncbi:crotonase [Bosea sp. WAO]|uniref:enoyl-CoA hydratase/isomerase family protein n=1 Tax=Bosea sp. WAO TaxID=406341 RepID=UPI000748E59E|nr:enoyl-CoA hydratase/isomerase family protein [Bosea sp. WAO]KUL94527.1 crotonase [Bosea sp. WAO]
MFDVERDGEIAVIRFNNPPVNAVSFANWGTLPGIIAQLESEAIAAMVFTGLPHKHFCGGNDFREFAALTPEATLAGTGAVCDGMRAVRESSIPAIAAIHGAAMGSGFMLSCACDIRLATPDARLGLPEVKVGAFGGYRIVREVLSQGEARLLTYTGQPLSGERAHQIGLVQKLADTPAQVLDAAIALAQDMAGLIKGRLRAEIKDCLNREDEESLWTAYQFERDLAARVMGQAKSE